MSVTLFKGSIFEVEADVIVNAANRNLAHGGGIARAIDNWAKGDGLDPSALLLPQTARIAAWIDDHATAPLPLATGDAHTTSPGLLPFQACIHAVGPVYGNGTYYEHELLELALHSVYREMRDHGFQSVVVPAISCGIFKFPVEQAAECLIQVASAYTFDTTFAVPEDDRYAAFQAALLVQEAYEAAIDD